MFRSNQSTTNPNMATSEKENNQRRNFMLALWRKKGRWLGMIKRQHFTGNGLMQYKVCGCPYLCIFGKNMAIICRIIIIYKFNELYSILKMFVHYLIMSKLHISVVRRGEHYCKYISNIHKIIISSRKRTKRTCWK